MKMRLSAVAILFALIPGISVESQTPVATVSIKPSRFESNRAGVTILLSSSRQALNYRYGILFPRTKPPQKALPPIAITDQSLHSEEARVVAGLPTHTEHEYVNGREHRKWEGLLFSRQVQVHDGVQLHFLRLWVSAPVETLRSLQNGYDVESVCVMVVVGDMRLRGDPPHSRTVCQEVKIQEMLDAPLETIPTPLTPHPPTPPRLKPGDIAT